jgi:hypothetical protein
MMGNVNQVTPTGNLNYDQTGTYTWNDPYTGKTYDIPTFTATQTPSPEQAALQKTNTQAQQNLSTLARDQSSFLQDYLGKPADLSNEAVSKSLFDLGRKRLDPMFADQRSAMEADLANKGIMIGSKAYDTAVGQQGQRENDAYNQLILSGQGQAFQQAAAARNQPINEITALLSGSQVSQPNYVSTNMPTIPTTDVAGLINKNYDQQLGVANFNAQQAAQKNAMTQSVLGGLFGLGAAGVYKYSDRRLKKDIVALGKINGVPIYTYQYVWGGSQEIGVMAQDIAPIYPSAVVDTPSGFKAVNYAKLAELIGAANV